jgi:hypothetical protein
LTQKLEFTEVQTLQNLEKGKTKMKSRSEILCIILQSVMLLLRFLKINRTHIQIEFTKV